MKLTALLSLATLAFALPSQKRQTCTNPTVRKEWRSLAQDQRDQFHQAVKCLQTKSSNYHGQSIFDRYSSLHVDENGAIHYTAMFLPWHRYFVHSREVSLQACGYSGPIPYWDWTKDSTNMANSAMFDPKTGFGGNGSGRNNCVANGPYGVQSKFLVGYPQSGCLTRQFSMNSRWGMGGSQHSTQAIQDVMQETNYPNFRESLEGGPHDAVHNEVAGNMAANFSPGDPLFFLHHANVDRLWALWQGRNATRLEDYHGNTVQGQDENDSSHYPLATLDDTVSLSGLQDMPDVKVRDLMDTISGVLCYTYDE